MSDTLDAAATEPQQSMTLDDVLAERADRREQEDAPESDPAPEVADIEDTQEIHEDATPSDLDDIDDEPEEVNVEDDDAEEIEAAEPSIEPPQFWEAEEKVKFAQLPRDMQQLLVEKDKAAQAAVTRATQEAAETRKQALERASQLDEQLSRVNSYVSDLDRQIADYEKVNWVQEFSQARTQEELANVQSHKAQFDLLVEQRNEASKTVQAAEARQLAESHAQVRAELPKLIPELADPAKAPKVITDILDYAVERTGLSREQVEWASASELHLAYKAMMYDRSQAAASTPRKKPKSKPTLKPSQAAGRTSPSSKRMRALSSKKELTVDEAVELRQLKRASRK